MMNVLKKIGYSIAKIEKYPEMAAEGTNKAILHLSIFALITAIIYCSAMIYGMYQSYQEITNYIDENFPEFSYSDRILSVEGEKPKIIDNQEGEISKVIIDDTDKTDEEIEKYKNDIREKGDGLLLLKNKLIIVSNSDNGGDTTLNYRDLETQFGINQTSKSELIDFFRSNKSFSFFLKSFVTLLVLNFIAELIALAMHSLMIALLGYVVAILLKVKMRLKAIFNMAAYAFTLSSILQTVYLIVSMSTGYKIDLFNIMYIGVASIYLIAAIFLTRIDLMKTQEELTRIKDVQEEVKEQLKKEEEKKEKEKKEENKKGKEEENTDEKKEKVNKKKENKKKQKKEQDGEPEGSSV